MGATRRASTGPVLGAAFAAALLAAPALAQEESTSDFSVSCEVSGPEVSAQVPVSDQRDMRQEVVRTITARSSRDNISLAVYGDDSDVLSDAARAVYDAHQCGLPVLGIVLGSPEDPVGVDVYVSGARVATLTEDLVVAARRSNLDIHLHLLAAIERAESVREELRPVAAASTATVTPTSLRPGGQD